MIEKYQFGSITIDGKTYDHDVEVRWAPKESLHDPTDQALEVLKWWRKEGHSVCLEDVNRAIEQNPETIIIGTGESGLMQVAEEVKNEMRSRGIELMIDITEQAVKTFNIINEELEKEQGKQDKVIGLFHLTC